MKHLTLKAAQINPPNEARDDNKLDKLLHTMRRNGWTGRKVVVRPDGEEYQALTGAHRLATAVALGIGVPVLLIEDDDLDFDLESELNEESDAEDFVNFLAQQGLTEVAEILEQESHLNNRNYLNFLRHWLQP